MDRWGTVTYFGALGTATIAMTLLLSGLRHAGFLGLFREELHTHQLLPRRVESATAVGVTAAELLLGAAFAARLVSDPTNLWQILMFAGAVTLLCIFSLYLITLLRRRPGVPCGCGIGTADVSSWHLVRNGLLLSAAGVSFFQPPLVWSLLSTPERLTVILSAASFTAAMYLLPQAMVASSAISPLRHRYPERRAASASSPQHSLGHGWQSR